MATLQELRGMHARKIMFPQQPPMMMIQESEWGETVYGASGNRFYHTPDGNHYPSVTTFLSHFEDPTCLDEWRERVGAAEAERISERACNRGELVHAVSEKYVTNDPTYDELEAGMFRGMFNQIRRQLDKNLKSVVYCEHALYSNKLKLAGRVDLCGMWGKHLAIIDFKNKNRVIRNKEWIEDYFLQTCIYAIMHAEQYGVLPEKLVVLAAVEEDYMKECQVFVEDTKDWIPKVLALVRKFHAEGGLTYIATP